MLNGVDHLCLSDFDSDFIYVDLRPLPRDAFFHSWRRRKSNDVCESDLGMGSP